MDATSYFPSYLLFVSLVAIFFGSYFLSSNSYHLQEKGQRNTFIAFLICVFLITWMGQRPVHYAFGDTINYAFSYMNYRPEEVKVDWSQEWLWQLMFNTAHDMGWSIHSFFTWIEFLYITSVFIAVCIFTPKNTLLGLLFVLTSFSFFTFGVNGLRNGLACHLLLLAYALYLYDRQIIAAIIVLAAFGIHRSIILPAAAFIASIYIIKDPKYAIYIWLASIPVSFFAGYFFINLFGGLGFDERMNQYLSTGQGNVLENTTSAFRWDFLLYSSMPVLMTWIVAVKRQVTDNWYNILASTYCLANAFWVLVIRASFTNRFAYLSWFLYPFVIAYPLIMLPVWDDQDNKTGLVLIAYTLLTVAICWFMHMI